MDCVVVAPTPAGWTGLSGLGPADEGEQPRIRGRCREPTMPHRGPVLQLDEAGTLAGRLRTRSGRSSIASAYAHGRPLHDGGAGAPRLACDPSARRPIRAPADRRHRRRPRRQRKGESRYVGPSSGRACPTPRARYRLACTPSRARGSWGETWRNTANGAARERLSARRRHARSTGSTRISSSRASTLESSSIAKGRSTVTRTFAC